VDVDERVEPVEEAGSISSGAQSTRLTALSTGTS